MVFSSLLFLLGFFPLCLVFYYILPRVTYQNVILCVFSIAFYAWGEPLWVLLMLGSALVDFCNGLFAQRYYGRPIAVLAIISTCVFNLGALLIFKYFDFISTSIYQVTHLNLGKLHFSLPLGISFYTFQTISYTFDVYRGEATAQRSFLKFLLFICNFHHLVAGPIVRYHHVASELDHRKFDLDVMSSGIDRFCLGLFKKTFLANPAGELTNQLLGGDLSQLSRPEACLGILCYTLQIYYDFSGYSDMAIGSGRIFGFFYRENFDFPYASQSITEFWRRWHISLGAFFRDYVYIPLGGNRSYWLRNVVIVWALTGLWHGASWNFVLWGIYFCIILIAEKLFLAKVLRRLPRILRHIYTLTIITFGWALFYFTDTHRLWQFMQALDRDNAATEIPVILVTNVYWLAFAISFCFPAHMALVWLLRPWNRLQSMFWHLRPLGNLIMLTASIAALARQSYNPFIYFRF